MKKDVITPERIKHDLDREVKQYTVMPKGIATFAAVSLIFLMICFRTGDFILSIIFAVISLILIAILVRQYLSFRKQSQATYISNINVIKSNFYSISTETAHSVYQDVVKRTLNSRRNRYNRYRESICVLRFGAGEWKITLVNQPYDTYMLYTWSENYTTSLQGLDNISCSGDDFFVVVDENTQNIIYAYPAKFFECDTELL
jgi:hypothetical protein